MHLTGILLMIIVLRDVFITVMPRGTIGRFCLAPFLGRKILWPPLRFIAACLPCPRWQAEVLGLFPVLLLMSLLSTWMFLLMAAIGLVAFSMASHFSPSLDSLLTAFYVSGQSILTLGSSDFVAKSHAVRFLLLGGALTGMMLIASVVSLTFGLIQALQHREVMVSLTSNIGGYPPSGIAILEVHANMQGRDSLPTFYDEWHHLCAEIRETHIAYALLPFFRSNDPCTSWLTALGAVLDSTSLLLSVAPSANCFSARMTYLIGCKLVNELARNFVIKPTQAEEISSDEYHDLYLRLRSADYCSNSENASFSNFKILRQEYLPAHRSLCLFFAVPLTPLSTEPARLPVLATADANNGVENLSLET